MEITKELIAYFIYLPIVICLTWFVSKTLFKNAKIYMLDIFRGREDIANATTKLFETGFYLLNIGYAFFILEMHIGDQSYQQMIEQLSYRLGMYTVFIGIMLFANVFLFFRGKKKVSKSYNNVS